MKIKVLFLCAANSCRSQMAEGWARHLKGDLIEAYSAGTDRGGLNIYAVRAMAEAGIDISNQLSKNVDELGVTGFDYVITLCGNDGGICPVFRGDAKKIHMPFDDPPRIAVTTGDTSLAPYRRVRDEIRKFIEGMPGNLEI